MWLRTFIGERYIKNRVENFIINEFNLLQETKILQLEKNNLKIVKNLLIEKEELSKGNSELKAEHKNLVFEIDRQSKGTVTHLKGEISRREKIIKELKEKISIQNDEILRKNYELKNSDSCALNLKERINDLLTVIENLTKSTKHE